MILAALDIATSTGVAVGKAGSNPKTWTVDLGKKLTEDQRFSNVLRLTHTLIEDHSPDLIAVEAAIGGKTASAFLIGLVACVRGVAANRGVPVEVCYLAGIRKHFLGRNITVRDFPALKPADAKRAIKLEVVKRCAMLGHNPQTDDEADAIALHDFACAKFAKGFQAKPMGGLFHG